MSILSARIWGIEVKSGRGAKASGLAAFRNRYPAAKTWLIGGGGGGVTLEEFFARPGAEWFR